MLFLCYRRADGSESTNRLREWLEERLPPNQVFMDEYSIYGGDDWRRVVEEKLTSSQAVLVIIGPQWLNANLEDEKNPSRFEIELALRHNIPIIPVLVQFAEMPTAAQVPESLAPFTSRHGIPVRPGRDRSGDLRELRRALKHHGVTLHRPVYPSDAPAEAKRLRTTFLEQVRGQIADGKRSALQNLAYIELGIREHPGAIDPPWLQVHPEDGLQQYSVAPGVTPWTILEARHSLLVLGEPGAGKTTILLDLGERLLQQAHEDETGQSPIPLYLNLSSWSLTRQPLREWLLERLQQDFGFDAPKGRKIVAGRLALLLDGLDEVAIQDRSACIDAINDYQTHDETVGRVLLVVCCRADDYFAQAARLRVASAIRVQPLSLDKVTAFLDQGSAQLAGLKHAIQQDQGLSDLARSPLWLNLMALVYRDAPSKQIPSGIARDQLCREIFARYVALRLDKRYRARPTMGGIRGRAERSWESYTPEDARRWLAWLGQMLKSRSLSRFYLESLQPNMAQRPVTVRILYILIFGLGSALLLGLIIGLVFGMVFGLIGGLALGLRAGLLFGGIFGLATGLYTGVIFGVVGGPGTIKLKDRWRITGGNIGIGLLGGILGGIGIGVIGGFRIALVGGLLFGIVFGLMFTVMDTLKGSSLDESGYEFPYAGMKRTGQNGLLFGIFFGLLFGVGGGLGVGLDAGLGGGPLLGLLFGFLCGLLAGTLAALFAGLGEYMKHWMLRFVLARQGAMPYHRYLSFLHFAVDRAILRRIANGFEFIHPLLRDYFATLNETSEDPRQSEPFTR